MSKLSSFNKTSRNFVGNNGKLGSSNKSLAGSRSGNETGAGMGMGMGMNTNSNNSNTDSMARQKETNKSAEVPDPSANVTSLGGLRINRKHQGFGLKIGLGSGGLQPSNIIKRPGSLTVKIKQKNSQDNNEEVKEHEFNLVNFPVDLVYTWVDGSDEEWVHTRNQHLQSQSSIPPDSLSQCRWENFDELRYSIESALVFAPWIRNIFVVVDHQRPWWFDENNPGKVVFIDHSIMYNKEFEEFLPVFNSHAIESLIYKIPGLAEHFIYANDDCFFGNYVDPVDFFTPDGKFKVFLTPDDMETELSLKTLSQQQKQTSGNNNKAGQNNKPKPIFKKSGGKMNVVRSGTSGSSSSSGTIKRNSKQNTDNLFILPYFTAQAKVNSVLDQVFGKPDISRKRLKHQMKPMRISTFEKCWDTDVFQEILFRTMSTRFRSIDDVDPFALVSHVGLLIANAVPAIISSKYYSFTDDHLTLKKIFHHLLVYPNKPKLYCLNDDIKNTDELAADIIKKGLEECLPHQKLMQV